MRSALVLALLLCACNAPTDPGSQVAAPLGAAPQTGLAALETDAGEYTGEQRVELRLRNLSAQPLSFNLCMATLEQQTAAGGWAQAPGEPMPCTMIALQLEPGQVASEQKPLAAGLPGGTYRFSAHVSAEPQLSETLHTAPFTLRAHTP